MENHNLSLVAFGLGNMATPVLEGLKKGLEKQQLRVSWSFYTPSQTKALHFADVFQGVCLKDLQALPKADVYLLGMKPQQFSNFASEVKGLFPESALVISMLAGVSSSQLSEKLAHQNVARIMPNTPCKVGQGVIPFYLNEQDFKKGQLWSWLSLAFSDFSELIDCSSEDELDTLTPYTGSGPAYFFEFVRLLADDLSSYGIAPEIAEKAMIQTCLGAAYLLKSSEMKPQSLRNAVTSKQGVTERALDVFSENDQWQELIHRALLQARKRNSELNQL